jgi:hypothetical protein
MHIIVSKLSDLVRFIQLFVNEPVFHVLYSSVLHVLFLFGEFKQLFTEFVLVFVDQFFAESLLGVLASDPLLEVWGNKVSLLTSCRTGVSSSL